MSPKIDGTGQNSTEKKCNRQAAGLIRKRANKRKKKKAKGKQQKKKTIVPKQNFSNVLKMGTFGATFTKGLTWKFKHEIAYWKSKAIALEYENRILHDIIRKSHEGESSVVVSCSSDSESDIERHCGAKEDESEDDVEVSEEYIKFLIENQKFRDDAKAEREKLKCKEQSEIEDVVKQMEAPPVQDVAKQRACTLQVLYGANWKKIAAQEMASEATFITALDEHKPNYWPNIPLNIRFG